MYYGITANAFSSFGTNLINFVKGDIVPLGVLLGGASIIAAGFAFLGTQRMKDWAKGHILYIAIGIVFIYFGIELAQSYVTSLGF